MNGSKFCPYECLQLSGKRFRNVNYKLQGGMYYSRPGYYESRDGVDANGAQRLSSLLSFIS